VTDWKAITEARPEERKKVDRKTRKFIPLTDAVIENHLLGQGNWSACIPPLPTRRVSFSQQTSTRGRGEYDSLAFLRHAGFECGPLALERSRSGKAAIFGFFLLIARLSANSPRGSWCVISQRTMERKASGRP